MKAEAAITLTNTSTARRLCRAQALTFCERVW
jgi:hypothetical protein